MFLLYVQMHFLLQCPKATDDLNQGLCLLVLHNKHYPDLQAAGFHLFSTCSWNQQPGAFNLTIMNWACPLPSWDTCPRENQSKCNQYDKCITGQSLSHEIQRECFTQTNRIREAGWQDGEGRACQLSKGAAHSSLGLRGSTES